PAILVTLHPRSWRRPPSSLTIFFAVALMTAGGTAGAAEDYPARAIKIVVPVAPGGITDIVARAAADYITAISGQPVVVENRTGAAGNIGVESVAKSPPDGYTLAVAATTQIAINPFTTRHLGYDPLKDLAPVAPIGEAP